MREAQQQLTPAAVSATWHFPSAFRARSMPVSAVLLIDRPINPSSSCLPGKGHSGGGRGVPENAAGPQRTQCHRHRCPGPTNPLRWSWAPWRGATRMEVKAVFDDGAAYERFMGRWSRTVGRTFLEWLGAPPVVHWLDVGCGTGAFTELVLGSCAPASIVAVDPSAEQIEYARNVPTARSAEFRVADALSLPFPDGSFDVVASALVINFIPDKTRGLSEMRRVARPGGLVGGYVWDFAGERASGGPLVKSLRAIGIEPPTTPGAMESSIEALQSLFRKAGFEAVEARSIEIAPTYRDFDDFWTSQTTPISPTGKFITLLPDAERLLLRNHVMNILRPDTTG